MFAMEQNGVKVNYNEYKGLTDHKTISIEVKLEELKWEKIDTKIFIKNKKFLKQLSTRLLDRLYMARSLKEVNQAFAQR